MHRRDLLALLAGTPALAALSTVNARGVAASPATQARPGELRLNLGGEPDTLDPSKVSFSNEVAVVLALFRGLLTYDEDLSLVPALALRIPSIENGGISRDRRTYTFYLRPEGRFSDGAPVTSAHFAYALRRAVTPGTSGDYADLFADAIQGGRNLLRLPADDPGIPAAQDAMGISAPDPKTLIIKLEEPNSSFLHYMALCPAFPLRQEIIEQRADVPFDQPAVLPDASSGPAVITVGRERTGWAEAGRLVGNGPFVLREWRHREQIVLARNEAYTGPDMPKLDTITLRMIEDPFAALTAYIRGELDQVTVPSVRLPQIVADATLREQLVRLSRLSTYGLVFNTERRQINDPRVRLGIAVGINRAELVRSVFNGQNMPAFTWVPPGIPGGADAEIIRIIDRDITHARQLLAASGLPDGVGLRPLALPYANSGSNPALAAYLQEQLAAVLGVELRPEPLSPRDYAQRRRDGDFDLAFFGWGADYPDAENFLAPNFVTGAGNNRSGYSNPVFDDLIARVHAETESDRRRQLLGEAQRVLAGDAPVIPLFHNAVDVLRRPYVRGVVDAPFGPSRFWSRISIAE